MKIGFYDSGLGGILILNAVRNHMPEYDYVYYGDTANLPFGNKSEEEIYNIAQKGIDWLFEAGAQIVIVACNTVSANALRQLQDQVYNNSHPERRVLGVIIPTVEYLHEHQLESPLLIATQRTVDSDKYQKELSKLDATFNIKSRAASTLVPKIEAQELQHALYVIRQYIEPEVGDIDSIVLGCTHYTVLKDALRKVFPDIHVVSQDEIIPKKLRQYLDKHNEIDSKLSRSQTIDIQLTEESAQYDEIKRLFFNV